jgi:hypothetical protein
MMQQPMMQQPLYRGLQESSQFPQQIGLQGLPPRNMKPSTELFGDNTGFGLGRSAYNQGLGTTGLASRNIPTTGQTFPTTGQYPLGQTLPSSFPGQNLPTGQTYPSTGQYPLGQTFPSTGQTTFPGQNLATSTGLSPNTTGTGLEGLPANPMQQRGGLGTALKEEIIKVEYEVFNIGPQTSAQQQPFVERTVTKLIEQPFAQTGLGTTETGLGTGTGWGTTQTGLGTSTGLGTTQTGLGTGTGWGTTETGLGTGTGWGTTQTGLGTSTGLGTTQTGLGTSTGLGTTQTGLGTSTGLGAQPTTGTYLGEKYMEAKNLESNVMGTGSNVGKASSVNPPHMV